MNTTHRLLAGALAGAASLTIVAAAPSSAATAKAGDTCTAVGTKSAALVCTKTGTKLVWVAGNTANASNATSAGVDGSWKATAKSVVGYRVKETLFGQAAEAYGRTSALTGTMTISGTTATAVVLKADLTSLKSDNQRRDGQVQGRILETAKFPTAMIRTTEPISFGKVPANQVEVKAKAKAALTLHGVTKNVTLDLTARRNGDAIEVVGSVPITFADYSIANPSNAAATVGTTGTLEFAAVFTR